MKRINKKVKKKVADVFVPKLLFSISKKTEVVEWWIFFFLLRCFLLRLCFRSFLSSSPFCCTHAHHLLPEFLEKKIFLQSVFLKRREKSSISLYMCVWYTCVCVVFATYTYPFLFNDLFMCYSRSDPNNHYNRSRQCINSIEIIFSSGSILLFAAQGTFIA